MEALNLESAQAMMDAGSVKSAVIQCVDGRRWFIVLRNGCNNEYVLRSERANPRRFATFETALGELRDIGMRKCDIDFDKWEPGSTTLGGI